VPNDSAAHGGPGYPGGPGSQGGHNSYGSSKPANKFFVGAVDEPAPRVSVERSDRSTSWQKGDAAGRLLPEQAV